MKPLRLTSLAALAVAVALLAGCQRGNPNAPANVSGNVTYKNAPLKGGTVSFFTKEKIPFNMAINGDGTYSAKELPVGEYTITVETESINPNRKKAVYGSGPGGKMKAPKGAGQKTSPEGDYKADTTYTKIPPKYNNPDKTPLKATLQAGSQTHNIELTD